jgi:hypothetical protein
MNERCSPVAPPLPFLRGHARSALRLTPLSLTLRLALARARASCTDRTLDNNQLDGAVPTEFGDLTALANLCVAPRRRASREPPPFPSSAAARALLSGDSARPSRVHSPPCPRVRAHVRTNTNKRYLSNNQLTGTIPAELGLLAALSMLYAAPCRRSERLGSPQRAPDTRVRMRHARGARGGCADRSPSARPRVLRAPLLEHLGSTASTLV